MAEILFIPLVVICSMSFRKIQSTTYRAKVFHDNKMPNAFILILPRFYDGNGSAWLGILSIVLSLSVTTSLCTSTCQKDNPDPAGTPKL